MSGFNLSDAAALYYDQNEVVNTIWYFHSAVVLGILWAVFTMSSVRTHKWVLRLVIAVFLVFAGVNSYSMYSSQHRLRVTGECIAASLNTAQPRGGSAESAFGPALRELEPHSEWELLACHWAVDFLVVLAILLSNRFFREKPPSPSGRAAYRAMDAEFDDFMSG